MIHPGLCSITFRQLTVAEIVALAARAELDCIEWGGDVHVPHGDMARAREARNATQDTALRTVSYGSYYRVAESEAEGPRFEAVLETALALGAPNVRVWAGGRGSADADATYRRRFVDETRRIATLAASADVAVSFEFHGGTLTDTNDSARALLDEIAHPNVFSYWQPAVGRPVEYRLAGLRKLLPWLTNLHVFQWAGASPAIERQMLAEGSGEWAAYLAAARATGREHCALLEFVADDSPERFLEDAATLHRWLTTEQGTPPP